MIFNSPTFKFIFNGHAKTIFIENDYKIIKFDLMFNIRPAANVIVEGASFQIIIARI